MFLSQVALPLGRLRGQRTHATRLHHQRTKKNQQQSLDGLGSVPPMRRIPGPLNLSMVRLAAPPKLPGDMTHAFVQFWVG